MQTSGEVRWCEPASEQELRLGCYFPDPLSDELLQQLATYGHLERRSSHRMDSELEVTIMEELASGATEAAYIVEYSSHGLRLNVSSPKRIGHRLLVHLQRSEHDIRTISVRSMWQEEAENGYNVGCSFTRPGALSRFNDSRLNRDPIASRSRSADLLRCDSPASGGSGSSHFWR